MSSTINLPTIADVLLQEVVPARATEKKPVKQKLKESSTDQDILYLDEKEAFLSINQCLQLFTCSLWPYVTNQWKNVHQSTFLSLP